MEFKLFRYYANTIGGLEDVVLNDLHAQLEELDQVRVEHGKRYGRIFFKYTRSPRRLLSLRSTENCFALLAEIHGITVGPPGLEYLCEKIKKLDMRPAIRLGQACKTSINGDSFQLNTTLQGGHRFTGAQLARSIQRVLVDQHGLKPGNGKDVLQFHLQVTGKRALFSLRLPGVKPIDSSVERDGLGGSLAYCLAYILGIQQQDTVVNATCGKDGLERIRHFCRPRLLVGCHHDKNHLVAAREIGKDQAKQELLIASVQGDLPLADASVDCLLSSLSERSGGGVDGEWRRQLEEFARVLHPGGVVALLVARPREFVTVLQTAGGPFEIMAGLPIYLKARKYTIFLLERLAVVEPTEGLLQIEAPAGSGLLS
jgi:hypothetical protein